ncbi:MAG: serine hydrolase domain-containing protein [Acidobacteriota bacterium]
MQRTHVVLLMVGLSAVSATNAGAQLSADVQAKIAAASEKTLAETGVPSASVAVVADDRIAYTQAFGLAHLRPDVKATPEMAYPIGSISKQFTATAMLLLQQDGKLSIDDKVAKYFPELTRSNDISIRNLLTMTSGYEDYAPQDYIIPAWLKPANPLDVVHEWAGKPLDFEPGTKWQYSNTNYVLASLIIEKVTGEPLMKFLRKRVFAPLGLEGVVNTYTEREKLKVTGYVSYALAPVREQPLEANGWYVGDGDLAMPASTLLKWDLAIMHQSLLKPESYKEFETTTVLKDGTDAHYGLGVDVRMRNGHKTLEHGGEVGGFVAENILFPDDKAAVVVLTNEVASEAASDIAGTVSGLVLAKSAAPAEDAFAPKLSGILTGLQTGAIDRSLFTSDCNAYFDKDALADFASTLNKLGAITGVEHVRSALRGGMTFGLYRVAFTGGTKVVVTVYLEPDGKIEQLLVVGKA